MRTVSVQTYRLNEDMTVTPVELTDLAEVFGLEPLKRTVLGEQGEMLVSTIFLGIDHGFGRGGDPVLFETMVFGAGCYGDLQHRYTSWEEALEDHNRIVAEIRREYLC